jgi:hypothetical protein
MPKIARKDILKKEKLVVKNEKTNVIKKIVFPHEIQFGIPGQQDFLKDVNFHNGLKGSLTQLTDGSDYLIEGSNITIVKNANGSITIAAGTSSPTGSFNVPLPSHFVTTASLSFAGTKGFNYTVNNIGTDAFFFVSGTAGSKGTATRGAAVFGGDVVVSGTLHGGSPLKISGGVQVGGTAIFDNINVGESEDGSYTDGLFTDITTSTSVGTVVDRFNEILKALAPGPAPSLDDIDHNNSSVSGKLSFGASNAVSGYTNSNTTAGFSAVDVDGTYGSSTSSNNLRIGVLAGSTIITGDLNEDVAADTHSSGETNYVANAFGDADSGTLKLYANGSLIHSVELTGSAAGHIGSGVPGSGTGTSTGLNGSGFTNLSSTGSAKFSDGTSLDLFKHRTGRYTIAAADQRNGWNYARITHSLASGDVNTNYVEWVNDPDSNALAGAGDAFDTLSMTGDVRLSGVKYHTGGTAQYRVRVTNAYKNVYSTSNITFTESNCTISNQSMPTAGNDEDKVLHLTGSATISASSLLNESISARAVVSHPLKSNLTTSNQTISNLLLWGYSNSSTVLKETFRRENYRLKVDSYNDQDSVTANSNVWDSTVSLAENNAGYSDGLMFYNQKLYTPTQGTNGSNFAGIANGPSNNVNYSGLTSGTKRFIRYFQNTSGGSKTGLSLAINGSGTIVTSGTSLNSSRIKVFVKLPTTSGNQSTGWMDLATAFRTGQVGDNDGCLEGNLDNALDATNTVTFGTQFVADDEYVVIKIEADAAFTGYVNQITVSWP